MFQRRHKLTILSKTREFFWPRIGWRRASNYWAYRMSRLPGSSFSVSAGFACGAAISFTPFVGLHFILGGLLAWSMRSNIIASAIGTAIGNPWTFPFIWVWIYNVGTWMGVGGMPEDAPKSDYSELFGQIYTSLLRFDMTYLAETAWPIFGPMLVGSIPTAIAAWFIAYYSIKPIIKACRPKRKADQS